VVTGTFMLALASKPMAVTLPFVLLLLDYWPLQRVAGWTEPRQMAPIPQEPIPRLLLEKLPLFTLSALSSTLTVWAQRSGGALQTLKRFPFGARLGNALDSYLIYIWKTLWPSGLGLFYPHSGASLAVWKPILVAILLGAISVAIWRQRVARPYLVVGWLWFLGTLVPVIGIVQVGDQAMADRYAYIPTIGLFVVITWGAFEIFNKVRLPTVARWALVSAFLLALWLISSRQLKYWENSATVWSHTLQVTAGNPVAEEKLAFARVNLGVAYASHGRLQDGINELEAVVQLTDRKDLSDEAKGFRLSALLNLGFAYALLHDYAHALDDFQEANQSDPLRMEQTIEQVQHSVAAAPNEEGYLRLSLLLRAKGQVKEASSILQEAIAANPNYIQARNLLNFLNASRT